MNRLMTGILFQTVLLCGAAFAFAEEGVTSGEIRIGMVNAQTGPAAGLGKGMKTGAEAVFRDINAKGGINGRKINLLTANDSYEPDKTIDQTLKMIEEQKVFALFGYVGTPTANAVIPIVKEAKIPLIGLFTGAMSLRQPVTPQVINIRASYDDEAEKLVDAFLQTGARKFAVFYQDDGFGLAVLSGTEKALKKSGLKVAAVGKFQRNTTAIASGLAAMMSVNPDVVIMVGPYTPLSMFIKTARSEGLKAQLATVSFVGTNNLVDMVGTAGDGVVISQVVPFPWDNAVPLARECASLLSKHFPEEKIGFVSLEGCLSAKALVAALERAGSEPTREGIIKAFEGMRGFDVGGMSLSFGPDNHQASKTVFLTQIKGGKIVPIQAVK